MKKAKKLGINISDLTELALRGFTFSAKEADASALYNAYESLFAAMKPIMDQYDTSVKIASEVLSVDGETGLIETEAILLLTDGSFYSETQEVDFKDISKISPGAFLTPKEILSNLVEALSRSMAQRKETIREVEMARRIVDAIASSLQHKSPADLRRAKKPTKSKSHTDMERRGRPR